jgi:hypothetical protein
MVELAYAGSRGSDYVIKVDINQAPAVVGVTDSNRNRPYITLTPGVRGLSQSQSFGDLWYHGLLTKVQRRFANGFSLLGAYTFAKSIDYASDNEAGTNASDNYNFVEHHRAVSDYNVAHTASFSGMYELPLGKTKWWGGWQTSGILYWRSGRPFTISQTQGVLSTGTGNRPNQVGDPVLSDPTVDKWFDPAAYQPVTETTGTYGDVGRNTVYGPEQFNIDMSLIKYTRFNRFNLELRVEAFNVLNHPQFTNPNGTIGNAGVARITAMLPNPSCSTCGTTQRQVQFAAKLSF